MICLNYENTMISGVYIIKNLINNKIYIGESVDILKRWEEHLDDLRNNKHHSYKLQEDFNTYGEENFKFEILEIVEDKEKTFYMIEMERIYLEYQYIKKYNSIKEGYNIADTFNDIISGKTYRYRKDLDRKCLLRLKKDGILSVKEKKEKSKKVRYERWLKNGLEKFKIQCRNIEFGREFIDYKKVFAEYLDVNIKKLNDLLINKNVLKDENILAEETIKNKNFRLDNNGTIQINYEGYKFLCNLIYEYGTKEGKTVFTYEYMKEKNSFVNIKRIIY